MPDSLASRIGSFLVQLILRGGAAALGLVGGGPLGIAVIVLVLPRLLSLIGTGDPMAVAGWLVICMIPLLALFAAVFTLSRPLAGGILLLLAAILFQLLLRPGQAETLRLAFTGDELNSIAALWLGAAALAFLAWLLAGRGGQATAAKAAAGKARPTVVLSRRDDWLRRQAALLGVIGGMANFLSAWLVWSIGGEAHMRATVAFLAAAILGLIGGSRVAGSPLIGGLAMAAGVLIAAAFGSASPAFGLASIFLVILGFGAVFGLAAAWRSELAQPVLDVPTNRPDSRTE